MKQKAILLLSTLLLYGILSCKTMDNKVKKPVNTPLLLQLIHVEGGEFEMGSKKGVPAENPVHKVKVDDFYISKYEITQIQWYNVMGSYPTLKKGTDDNYPVYNITWAEAAEFCNKLSEREGLDPCYSGSGTGMECNFSANGYRLPTEAEWEYAARGGIKNQNFLYAGTNNIDEAGWYNSIAEGIAHEVGLKIPNELGLYDMSGNMWEWCWDWFDAEYYATSPSNNPTGPSEGIYKVLRGGGWGVNAYGLRCTNRYYGAHRNDNDYGFRCVRRQ